MINLGRIAVWLFIAQFAVLIPSTQFPVFKLSDETCYLLLSALAIVDCVGNRRWRQYWLFWTIVAVMTFYFIYSITAVHYNTMFAVAYDYVLESKTYLSFAAMLGMRPKLTKKDKEWLRIIAVASVAICFGVSLGGNNVIKAVIYHPAYVGATIFVSAMIYLFVSIDENGEVKKRDMYLVALFILSGLICARSKYYGEAVLALFFMFVYKPGMLRHLTAKHAMVIGAVVILVCVVSWSKFEYYFINGAGNLARLDVSAKESFARPVLYYVGGLIMMDHFPFGSGLASYASYPSSYSYSDVYVEYGIDKVHGLSQSYPEFICDAYYPLLAQFGVAGVVLFISFFVYVCSLLRRLVRHNPQKYRFYYVVGSLVVCFELIECVAGTIFAQSPGLLAMILVAVICSQALELPREEKPEKALTSKPVKKYL